MVSAASPLETFTDRVSRAAGRAALLPEGRALPFVIRADVALRERGMCRATLDGRGFAWCTRHGTDLHERSGSGVSNGDDPPTRRTSAAGCILLCGACHRAHHGHRITITIDDANRPLGVRYTRG